MTEYCSRTDISDRLTSFGFVYATDRDTLDEVASESEQSRYVDTAIQWAGSLLDELVSAFMETGVARGQGNQWLRYRAIDLAVWRLLSHGGRDVPASSQLAYDMAVEAMDRIRSGTKIPGLRYNEPSPNGGGSRWPRAVNVR